MKSTHLSKRHEQSFLGDRWLVLEPFGTDSSFLHPKTDGGIEADGTESYAHNTPLTWLFGESPETRVIAALLSEHDHEVSKSELARLAGVEHDELSLYLMPLDEFGIALVEDPTRPEGMVKIRTDDEIAHLLGRLEERLIKREIETGSHDSSAT